MTNTDRLPAALLAILNAPCPPTDKATILASIAANGLTSIGRNKWADEDHLYSIVASGNGYEIKCVRTSPWPGMNAAMRAALRPMFLEARKEGRV